MKKIYIIFVIFFLFFCENINAYAEDIVPETAPEISQEQNIFFVDAKIQKELKSSIQNVYGKDKVDEIYNNLIQHVRCAIEKRPQKLKEQDIKRTSDWFKDEIIYMFYVNQFGVVQNNKDNTLS